MLLFTFSYRRKSFIRTNCLFIFIQTGIHDDAGTLAGSFLGQYHVLLCTEQKRLVHQSKGPFTEGIFVAATRCNFCRA